MSDTWMNLYEERSFGDMPYRLLGPMDGTSAEKGYPLVLSLHGAGGKGTDNIKNLRGMGPKYPLVSVAMVAILVSLTGLPPTVGFYGKYLLFIEGVDAGLMWLVVVAALNSVVSLFYYFRVVKALFLEQGEGAPAALSSPAFTSLILLLGAQVGAQVRPSGHLPQPGPHGHLILGGQLRTHTGQVVG